MKNQVMFMLALCVSACFMLDAKSQNGMSAIPLQEWKLPMGIDEDGVLDIINLPDTPYMQMVVYGYKLMNETDLHIGPDVEDPKKRFSGNHLSCSSCHANGGIIPFQSGYIGIAARFPQYNGRADKIINLEDRINGCMQRSMNGKPMPLNSKEIRAMVAYMTFLSQGTPINAKTKGQGLIKIDYIDRAADPSKGKIVFEERCSSCHGEHGEGVINPEKGKETYYVFPALWGEDSYNTGAGLYRLLKCAAYIKGTMPKGEPTLTLEESYDVCSFINTQPRPIKSEREKDFPNLKNKPIDMDVGPYADEFSEKEHRFGPYKQMIKD